MWDKNNTLRTLFGITGAKIRTIKSLKYFNVYFDINRPNTQEYMMKLKKWKLEHSLPRVHTVGNKIG